MADLRDICEVFVPFGDGTANGKLRPSLIVGVSKMGQGQDQTVLVAVVSSKVDAMRGGDILIPSHATCGLSVPSKVRARRLVSVDAKLVRSDRSKHFGRVDEPTFTAVLSEISALFSP